ncbi:MAG: hypothetical protein SXV54_19155 [Chloroflexota bacterium]|nr:hypothetical protein [Chloroflexota bacterium]
MRNRVGVLVVARQGRLRGTLNALLKAMPQVETVENVDDGSAAMSAFAGTSPALVVLGSNLTDDANLATLQQIKIKWPQTRCILLADDIEQQRAARAGGADVVLLRGFPITQFFAAVERLLPDTSGGGEEAR